MLVSYFVLWSSRLCGQVEYTGFVSLDNVMLCAEFLWSVRHQKYAATHALVRC